MKLDPHKLIVDESRSNPLVVAMVYPKCPTGEVCFGIVVGFGSIIEKCESFKEKGEEAECMFKEDLDRGK